MDDCTPYCVLLKTPSTVHLELLARLYRLVLHTVEANPIIKTGVRKKRLEPVLELNWAEMFITLCSICMYMCAAAKRQFSVLLRSY
jgi:hypothetical protein